MDVNGSHPPFDRSALVERLMGDEALAVRIIEEFVVDTGAHLAALGQAVRNGDARSVLRIGHSVMGAAGNVGALALSEAFARLEAAGLGEDLRDAASVIQLAEERLYEVELSLHPLRQTRTGTDR